jgi:hypothetical protein
MGRRYYGGPWQRFGTKSQLNACPLTASMKGKNEDVNLVEMDMFLVAACLSLSFFYCSLV